MSVTDFLVSQLVNTITLEQIDAIVIRRYRLGRGIFGALLGPFQGKYTEIFLTCYPIEPQV
jgi:hypothetical protein